MFEVPKEFGFSALKETLKLTTQAKNALKNENKLHFSNNTCGYVHIGTHNLPEGVKTVNEGGQRTYRRKRHCKSGD